MADFKKSVDALQFIKDLSMPQQAGKIIKASDAYAPFADQGIFTAPTMADRTIASPKGKLKGGMRFPYLQNVDPAYEGEVWGFGAGNMSTKLLNQFENVPADKLLLSTILGNKYMHHSNPEVSAELIKHYRKGIKDKKLSTELRDVTNRRINQLTDEDGNPIFAPDSDVTDPAFYRSLDTFDKRAAMGNIMGGVGLNEGTERKRRVANQIFDYEGLMRKMTEPSIIGAPNSSIGSRIFTLSGTKSERPDLNKAYPHVVGGLDLNVDFGQVPFQHYLKDYTDNMMQTRGKVPGWFNLTRSSDLPTQEITDQWLQHLKNQGYAEGGEVEHMQAGGIKKAVGALGELTQAAPKKITHGMLRRRGMEIGNKEEADALYSSGHRIFGMHELDEVPFEITDRKLFDSYAPDMMLAYPPDKPILKADGGGVEHMQAGGIKKAAGLVLPELENAIAGVATAGRSPIVPMPNRWFLQPDKFPHMQGMVDKVLERTGRPRESFTSGAFVDPRTGEVLDSKILEDVGVVVNPHTNRPAMSAGKEAGIDELEKELGLITKSNLVRNSLFKRSGGDPMLDDLAFLATIERSGMGHKYGLSTEYGSPTLLHNSQTGANPTLRPTSRGDVFGVGDVVGQVKLGKGIPHDVYEKLFVAPAGMDVQGVKLHKAEGGVAHKQAGGMMGLVNEFKALQAAHNAARLAKTTRNIPPVQDMVISQAEREANLARYLENAAVKDRMYHATGDDFSVVDVDKSDPRSKFGSGFYMTPNTNYANFFANMRMKEGKPSQVMPVYSSVQNPYEISGTQNIPLNGIDREKLKALGYDGVLFRNDAGNVQELVAFDPTQVKSAIGNRGTYDPTQVEINKAEGGAVHLQIGGMTPEPAGGSARQQTFESEHMAEGGDIMRQLFDHALEKGDIHDMTHALLVQQHEAEHG